MLTRLKALVAWLEEFQEWWEARPWASQPAPARRRTLAFAPAPRPERVTCQQCQTDQEGRRIFCRQCVASLYPDERGMPRTWNDGRT